MNREKLFMPLLDFAKFIGKQVVEDKPQKVSMASISYYPERPDSPDEQSKALAA